MIGIGSANHPVLIERLRAIASAKGIPLQYEVNPRFSGTDADAMVAGDVAMLDGEVTAVLKALRSNGINVVAIHHHMTGVAPAVIFLHYYGTGPAPKLAQGVRAAIDELGRTPARAR